MHLLKRALLIPLALLATALCLAAWKIGPRNFIGMMRYDQRQEGSLKVGDRVPDVSLVSLDGKTPVRLADRIGARPLVLVFGSYT